MGGSKRNLLHNGPILESSPAVMKKVLETHPPKSPWRAVPPRLWSPPSSIAEHPACAVSDLFPRGWSLCLTSPLTCPNWHITTHPASLAQPCPCPDARAPLLGPEHTAPSPRALLHRLALWLIPPNPEGSDAREGCVPCPVSQLLPGGSRGSTSSVSDMKRPLAFFWPCQRAMLVVGGRGWCPQNEEQTSRHLKEQRLRDVPCLGQQLSPPWSPSNTQAVQPQLLFNRGLVALGKHSHGK